MFLILHVIVTVGHRGSTTYKGAGHTGMAFLFLIWCSAWVQVWDSGILT